MTYNLLDEQWIPVLWQNGTAGRVGIKCALKQRHAIRQLAAPNPMDNVALLRFLLAVLQWCKPGVNLPQDEAVAGVPGAQLEQLEVCKASFDLFGDNDGFYQDPKAEDEAKQKASKKNCDSKSNSWRPVADLLQELPSGTNIAHFRHTRDGRDDLCPACCAIGLVRLSAFASASTHGAGQQKPAGINGATPMYAVAMGSSLLETMRLNPPLPTVNGDSPSWCHPEEAPNPNSIGGLAAFTWLPRRVWLCRKLRKGACSACGKTLNWCTRLFFSRVGNARSKRSHGPKIPTCSLIRERGRSRGNRMRPRALPFRMPAGMRMSMLNSGEQSSRLCSRASRARLRFSAPALRRIRPFIKTPCRISPVCPTAAGEDVEREKN